MALRIAAVGAAAGAAITAQNFRALGSKEEKVRIKPSNTTNALQKRKKESDRLRKEIEQKEELDRRLDLSTGMLLWKTMKENKVESNNHLDSYFSLTNWHMAAISFVAAAAAGHHQDWKAYKAHSLGLSYMYYKRAMFPHLTPHAFKEEAAAAPNYGSKIKMELKRHLMEKNKRLKREPHEQKEEYDKRLETLRRQKEESDRRLQDEVSPCWPLSF
ncbi:hypothetical protein BGX34_012205 [Mortierella sp. NVP85]|nr:hypothetical protein BGX34_012205 [Mortierella sp. NVP85]